MNYYNEDNNIYNYNLITKNKPPAYIGKSELYKKVNSHEISKKDKIILIILKNFSFTLFIIGYLFLTSPYLVDQYSRINQTQTIEGYENNIVSKAQLELDEAFNKTVAYNEKVYKKQLETPFIYEGQYASVKDDEYNSLPLSDTSEIGMIEIPQLNIDMPIGHGTSDELLQKEVGHIYGTSLPVGGENTHAVLAGHSALQEAEIFTRLNEMKIGDEFQIKVLGRTLYYKVDQIKTVLPEDADQYLQISPGKDYVTLYTCTPYGINTHRLLIRGERIEENNMDIAKTENTNDEKIVVKNKSYIPIIKIVIIGIMIPLSAIFIVNKIINKLIK